MLPFSKISTVAERETLRMQLTLEWSALPLCRNRVYSTSPVCPRRTWHVRAYQVSHSVQHARLHPKPSGQCLSRYPERALETVLRRSRFRLQSAPHRNDGRRCVWPRWQCGTLRPSKSDANLATPLPPPHESPQDSDRLARQQVFLRP